MTPAALSDFRRQVDALKNSYEKRHLKEIERVAAKARKKPEGAFCGKGRVLAIEAHVRQYLLDPLLGSLGWRLSDPAMMLVEDAVDPMHDDEHRRFLDYHGREAVGINRDRSLMIIEAKRPGVLLPGPAGATPEYLAAEIVVAFDAIKKGKSKCKNFSAEWLERFSTLSAYATRVKNQSGEAPCRVVITNGEWFIVFVDPDEALVEMDPTAEKILVFRNLEEVISLADKFCDHLAYQSLSSFIPTQHPSELYKFVEKGEQVQVALAIELQFNEIGNVQPNMAVRLYAKVRTARKVWLDVRKDYEPPFEGMPGKRAGFVEQMSVLQGYARELVRDIEQHATVVLISADEVEKIARDDGFSESWAATALRSNPYTDVHYLTLGKDSFYVVDRDEFDDCPFHFHGSCASTGDGAMPIFRQSRIPPVYFASGSPFHCAHKKVHVSREQKCVIQLFETHMCCQRCSFLPRCWPTGTEELPCSKV